MVRTRALRSSWAAPKPYSGLVLRWSSAAGFSEAARRLLLQVSGITWARLSPPQFSLPRRFDFLPLGTIAVVVTHVILLDAEELEAEKVPT
jgi:hypothetical protein